MSTLQDIADIAKKALEDANKATESDIAPIYSDGLDAIVELCQFEQDDAKHAVLYPAAWTAPKYRFGQSVLARAHGGESLISIIGMRFRIASKWEYQVVDFVDGKPDVYCNGRWYAEAVLSEETKP